MSGIASAIISLLAVINSQLLALACGWLIGDEIHLTLVAVSPQYRRKGLAKYILSRLLEKAKKLGMGHATLEVSTKNKAAQKLYKSCGFRTAGERTNYYKDGSGAIIKWLSFK